MMLLGAHENVLEKLPSPLTKQSPSKHRVDLRIFSPVLQRPGLDEWHSITKSEINASAGNGTQISQSRVSTLNR